MQIAEETATRRTTSDEKRFVLHNVSWELYETLLSELGDRHVFVTFDGGELEFMAPSLRHDLAKSWIGRLLESMAYELGIEIMCCGSTTWKRKDLAKGLEPDECFYIRNEIRVRHKQIDLSKHPPPDLALEIEVSRSALDRLGIYAALGVPEVWCYDGKTLRMYHLDNQGSYQLQTHSLQFPLLPSRQFERFIKMRESHSGNEVLRLFLKWVREHLNS